MFQTHNFSNQTLSPRPPILPDNTWLAYHLTMTIPTCTPDLPGVISAGKHQKKSQLCLCYNLSGVVIWRCLYHFTPHCSILHQIRPAPTKILHQCEAYLDNRLNKLGLSWAKLSSSWEWTLL